MSGGEKPLDLLAALQESINRARANYGDAERRQAAKAIFKTASNDDVQSFADAINADVSRMADVAARAADRATFDRLMRETYAKAIEGSHSGGRVTIDVGSAILRYMRQHCFVDVPVLAMELWGFPIHEVPEAHPAHISVRIVHPISH